LSEPTRFEVPDGGQDWLIQLFNPTERPWGPRRRSGTPLPSHCSWQLGSCGGQGGGWLGRVVVVGGRVVVVVVGGRVVVVVGGRVVVVAGRVVVVVVVGKGDGGDDGRQFHAPDW
jgi:hypothetical protein